MSNQLIKETSLGFEKIFPKNYILNLKDKDSGKVLSDILKSFNMLFLNYTDNKSNTRKQVPISLRHVGLWITYIIDKTIVTEWYNDTAIDDYSWSSDANWREGSNMLVGDISISKQGTWVINGEDSGITIKGDKGDSPVIRIYDNKILVSYDKGVTYEDLNNTPVYTKFRFNSLTNTYLVSYDLGSTWLDISDEKVYHKFRYNSTTNTYLESTDFGKTWSNVSAEKVYYQFRYNEETNTHLVSTDLGLNWTDVSSNKVYYLFRTNDNRLLVSTDLGTTWENCSEPIAAWFRWTDTSGTGNIGKVQISRDLQNWSDLSPTMTNNLYIKGYVATVGDLPSNAAIGDIYMVGPTYDESDATHDYPHYRMWVKLSSGWVDNGEFTNTGPVSTSNIINGAVTIEKVADSAIDDEPTTGSQNLVKSGGVDAKISELSQKVIQYKEENSVDSTSWMRIRYDIKEGNNYRITKKTGTTTTIATTNSPTSTATDARLQTILTENFNGTISFKALVDAQYLIIYCASAVEIKVSDDYTLESQIEKNTNNIDSLNNNVSTNNTKIKEIRNRAYFHNLDKPIIELGSNSYINVTIPNADLRIYKESRVVYINAIQETTFNIPNTNALIVRDGNFVVVQSSEARLQDYILVENTGGCVSGLLAHYFNTETREILNNTNENVTENTLAIGLHDEKTITSDWAVLTGPIIAGKEYTIKTSSICGAVYYLNSNIHDTSKRGSKIADSVRYEYKFVATENASHIEVFVNEGSVSLDFFGLKQVTYELENKMDSLVGEEDSINLSASTTEWLISEYKFVKGKRYKINCVSGRTTTIVLLDTNSPTQEHRVQTIATSLISGEYVLFTAEVNAPYIGVYVVGNVELKVQKYNTIQELTEKCSSIEDSIAPIISAISPKDIAAYYATKKGYIKNVEKESDFNCLFFSDVHGNSGLQRNTQRLFELADSIDGLNAVINGGDTGWGIIADAQEWYNTLENNCSKDILNCIGNHDLWTDRGSWSWAEVPTLTYQIFISNMLNRVSDIVQPNEASESNPLLYYYKDYNNVRVIVLNALSTQVSPYYWTEEQKVWLKSVLTNAKNNSKNVIIVNHYPMSKSNADIVQGSRWTEYDNIITGTNDGQEAPEELFSIVHEFISNGGKFICYLTGHKHSDNLLTHKLYPEQLMINIASAKNVNHSTGYMANDDSEKEFDCANYIGVDIAHSLIKVYRIGWNRDLSMIARNTLCYDYANMSVVFED